MGAAPGYSAEARAEELEALLQRARVALELSNQVVAATQAKLSSVTTERDNLRRAYRQLMEQFELLRRRIFVAKAERVDATQLELEFAATKQQLDALAQQLGEAAGGAESSATTAEQTEQTENPAANAATGQSQEPGPRPAGKPPAQPKAPPKGRRNLAERDDMIQKRIEIRDEALEQNGGTFMGWEESYKLGYQRPGPVRVVIARAKYKVAESQQEQTPDNGTTATPSVEDDETEGESVNIITAKLPALLIRRGLLAPSMLARIMAQKFLFGMPYFRLEELFGTDGIELDRSTMARSVEEVGACLGSIVLACADDARKHAFCLSTDATGVAIRPEPLEDGRRQACRKGHFFVVLADKKHVFFEYQPKHTSAAVCDMFRGFSGYIQADAHAVFDALFRGDAVDDPLDAPLEVACWAHARRRFWEAAVCGFTIGREGLLRIRKLYELDEAWVHLPPSARFQNRKTVLAPLVNEFFEWVRAQNDVSSQERGVVKKALGYALRQEAALRRFLEDGRLRLDNNRSENALRVIASGRKAWLFFGSDDTAEAAANIFSLIASCKLHGIDPELYLTEVIRILPYWPRNRVLELAPAYWASTRSRLAQAELAAELGHITVPPPLDAAEQSLPN